jgi:hypothetical protein
VSFVRPKRGLTPASGPSTSLLGAGMRVPLTAAAVAVALPFLAGAQADLSTVAGRFSAAKVVVLVRLVEPPEVDARTPDLGELSKFLVVRSWKGPFPVGSTITAATAAVCGGALCAPYPTQVGALVVIFSLGDVQPLWPIMTDYPVDEAHIEEATGELDALAAHPAPNNRWRGP